MYLERYLTINVSDIKDPTDQYELFVIATNFVVVYIHSDCWDSTDKRNKTSVTPHLMVFIKFFILIHGWFDDSHI
ncbi:hypothetical protein NQ318_013239 [Aromia moschata]|uniref:Uncharacterized protein n=1 Tax=Aromia moschata TaxID=1265417 RepID=A0AAV8YBU7_9CUCU|nr:hypothetical protein NQ318_013239 [Aromia moschata]